MRAGHTSVALDANERCLVYPRFRSNSRMKLTERLDGFERDGVVERDAHAANRPVADDSDDSVRRGFLGKLFFSSSSPPATRNTTFILERDAFSTGHL